MRWTKRIHHCIIFQTFECSNESSTNSSCYSWNCKVRVYSNVISLFSVMKDNSSVTFSSNLIYTLDKPHVYFTQTSCILYTNLIYTLHKPHVYFTQTSYILETKIDHHSETLGFLSGWVKIHKIPHIIFETASQFFFNFASLFSVKRDNSSVFFS